jgi:sugar phosphate permease
MVLLLVVFDDGVMLTVTIALLGLFLYPDQPILTAAYFDVVDREVATTGLGAVSFVSFLMAATSPLIAGGLYEAFDFQVGLYYVAGLFALATVILAILPLSKRIGE